MMRRTRLALKLRCDMGDNWLGYHHGIRHQALTPKLRVAIRPSAIPLGLMGVLAQAACKGALGCL